MVGVVKSFVQGMKSLVADVKKVRQLQKTMKDLKFKIDGEFPINPVLQSNSEITSKDLQFINKVCFRFLIVTCF